MQLDFIYNFLKIFKGKTRYHYLTKYIEEYKCKNIIEVGTWNGKNSKRMLKAASTGDKSSKNITYWGFDLWEQMNDEIYKKEYSKRPPNMQEVKSDLMSTGCNINLFQGDTKETLKKFYDDKINKIDIDFIYIDGGHSFDTIQSDWENLIGFIKENTLTIFDDYYIYISADPTASVGDDLEPTFGCSQLINSLDKNIWNVTMLPHYDQFGPRKVYFVLVTKK